MTQDEIIAMAKEAGRYASHQTGETGEWNIVRDLRFAALVAAAEREACAQVCESWGGRDYEKCAAAIRARGSHVA